MDTTTPVALNKPATTDQVSDLRGSIGQHADQLKKTSLYDQGPYSTIQAGGSWESSVSNAGVKGRLFRATDLAGKPLFLDTGTSWEAISNAALVNTLPASPFDGQELFFLADATSRVKWHLRYDASKAGALKWEGLGRSCLSSAVAAGEQTTSETYTNLATTGPSISVPLSGEYDIHLEALAVNSDADQDAWMSVALGAAAAQNADRLVMRSGGTNGQASIGRTIGPKTLSAGDVVLAKYRKNGGTFAEFRDRRLELIPRWLG